MAKAQLFKRGLSQWFFAFSVSLVALNGLGLGLAHGRDIVQAFLLAARAEDTDFVGQMAQMNLNPRTRDDLGNSLLMLAIREGGEKMALALLDQPPWQEVALLDTENRLGENALMIAAHRGLFKSAQRLIDLGAATNRQGWGPLHYAATTGQLGIIQLLVESHAYVDSESPNGTTPLMMAARFGHRKAAEMLISLGADPTLSNQAGMTAKNYALEANQRDFAFWLELQEIAFVNRYLLDINK